MNNSEKGFTLIELMITVAIIGILATLAIPAYQRYVARAQVTEAVILLEGARLNVEEYITQSGSFPATLTELDALGSTTSGKYVSDIAGTPGSHGAGVLVAEFKASNIATPIRSTRLSFNRSASGAWTCSTGPTQPINEIYLPQACR